MQEFLTSIGNFVMQIHWSTWVSMVVFIALGVRAFGRGAAKEFIGLGFMLFALIVAWLFYQHLAQQDWIIWLSQSAQSAMAIAFGVIFILLQLSKSALYKLVSIAAKINEPCALNKGFLIFILLLVSAFLSRYTDQLFILGADFWQYMFSFTLIFFAAIGVFASIFKLFRFTISSTYPCLLRPIIQAILDLLKMLDGKLSSSNINENSRWLGALIGLIKGFIFIVFAILILQSTSSSSGQYLAESQNSFKIFQSAASSIKPALSGHLLFIKN